MLQGLAIAMSGIAAEAATDDWTVVGGPLIASPVLWTVYMLAPLSLFTVFSKHEQISKAEDGQGDTQGYRYDEVAAPPAPPPASALARIRCGGPSLQGAFVRVSRPCNGCNGCNGCNDWGLRDSRRPLHPLHPLHRPAALPLHPFAAQVTAKTGFELKRYECPLLEPGQDAWAGVEKYSHNKKHTAVTEVTKTCGTFRRTARSAANATKFASTAKYPSASSSEMKPATENV